MGMQVFFDVADLQHAEVKFHIEEEDGIASLYCSDGPEIRIFNVIAAGQTAWFDVGSASGPQMSDIKWLIEHRICFSCS